jgi:hypothetical protein
VGLDALPGWGNMKQQQTREATPIWVWMAFGLMGIGIAAYLTGYWMIEEMLAFP